jgi:cyclopropane fatty-acyl-phospholipid synthase-like methyltransferase
VSAAGVLYDALPAYLGEEKAYVNQGYWKDDPPTHDAANEAMAALLGRIAGLGPGQRVLDAGFGWGEQEMFWLSAFGPEHVTGVNLSKAQVAVATRRVLAAGQGSRVELREASATDLPFTAGSFDRVVALESAHHFDTRADFFAEAYRVLRPGGRLATVDIVPMPGAAGALARALRKAEPGLIPAANMHGRDEYARQLRTAGFANVRVVSIREHVWAPQARHLAARMRHLPPRWRPDALAAALRGGRPAPGALFFDLQVGVALGALSTPLTAAAWIRAAEAGPLDYVAAVGDRPGGPR